MAPVVYKLIDGPFLCGLCDDVASLFEVSSCSIDFNQIRGSAHRAIYYDAMPVKKSAQTDEAFALVEAKKLAFFEGARSVENVLVRDGVTRLRTKSERNRMSEVLEQKGVDTWIAVDATKFALTGIADEVHIFTSDADLYPVFEVMQDTRCRGRLYYERGRAAAQLINSADSASAISISEVARWIGLSSMCNVHTDPPIASMTFERSVVVGDSEFNIGRYGSFYAANFTGKDGSRYSGRAKNYVGLFDLFVSCDNSVTWRELKRIWKDLEAEVNAVDPL